MALLLHGVRCTPKRTNTNIIQFVSRRVYRRLWIEYTHKPNTSSFARDASKSTFSVGTPELKMYTIIHLSIFCGSTHAPPCRIQQREKCSQRRQSHAETAENKKIEKGKNTFYFIYARRKCKCSRKSTYVILHANRVIVRCCDLMRGACCLPTATKCKIKLFPNGDDQFSLYFRFVRLATSRQVHLAVVAT